MCVCASSFILYRFLSMVGVKYYLNERGGSVGRLIIFIDSNNFYKNSERLLDSPRPKFNWGNLILGLRDKYQERFPDANLLKAYYYTALSDREDNPTAYDRQSAFITAIERIPFIETRVGYLSRIPRNKDVPVDRRDPSTYVHRDKRTDVTLSNDLLENAILKKYEHAAIVSADGDFDDTIQRIKVLGIKVCAMIPLGAPASSIRSAADDTIYIEPAFLQKHRIK